MKPLILAIDQGTTGTTALIFDENFKVLGKVNHEFPQHFPEASWVEHDLEEIWNSVVKAVGDVLALAKVSGNEISAIGITNQRETTCLWYHGPEAKPLHRAIVWQDRRTHETCQKLKKQGHEKYIHRKTGLLLDPYFSGTKLQWLLKNIPSAKTEAKQGKIAFGTIETYLLYRLTGGAHRTEASNASRTLLMDIKTCQWDEDLLKLFQIPNTILPEICANDVEFGKTKGFPGLPNGIPITGMIGDQQSALFGQACFEKGTAKCTYGTGAFALVNTGATPVFSKNRLLTTVGWRLGGKTIYGIEGSAFITGAAVQWLRDGLQLFDEASQVEALATSVPNSDGVVFVPALSGMGAPHWLPTATGLITGLSRRTTKAHVARATLEGVAFQVRELLEAMAKDYGKKIQLCKVDGGGAANDFMIQFQSDLLGYKLVRSSILETTAMGAGLQAGLSVGVWKNLDEIKTKWRADHVYEPRMSAKQRKAEIDQWDRAMKAVSLLTK
jgi:glycerol kinase